MPTIKSEAQKEDVCQLNNEVIHAGDVQSDAILVTTRFSLGSSERQKLPDLYSLSVETAKEIDTSTKSPMVPI